MGQNFSWVTLTYWVSKNFLEISKLESALQYSIGPATSPHQEADKFGQIYLQYMPEQKATSSFVLGCSKREKSKN